MKNITVCLKFTELKDYRTFVMTGVGISLMILAMIIFCVTKLVLTLIKNKQKEKEKAKKKKKIQKKSELEKIIQFGSINPDHFIKNDEAENPGLDGTPFERMKKSTTLRSAQSRLLFGKHQRVSNGEELAFLNGLGRQREQENGVNPEFGLFDQKNDLELVGKNSEGLLLKWIERVKVLEKAVQRLSSKGYNSIPESDDGPK